MLGEPRLAPHGRQHGGYIVHAPQHANAGYVHLPRRFVLQMVGNVVYTSYTHYRLNRHGGGGLWRQETRKRIIMSEESRQGKDGG